MAVEYVCERCKGTAVTIDAWAEWDAARQRWRLVDTFQFAFCHSCHRDTHLFPRPLPSGRPGDAAR